MSDRRAFVVVLDACGVGALPDAADYGDAGSNTLGHLAEAVGGLDLPVLQRLGLGSIIPIEGVPPADEPVVHGRLHPLGPGKESTTGHWELMGVVPQHPLPDLPGRLPARRDRARSRRRPGCASAATGPTAAPRCSTPSASTTSRPAR